VTIGAHLLWIHRPVLLAVQHSPNKSRASFLRSTVLHNNSPHGIDSMQINTLLSIELAYGLVKPRFHGIYGCEVMDKARVVSGGAMSMM